MRKQLKLEVLKENQVQSLTHAQKIKIHDVEKNVPPVGDRTHDFHEADTLPIELRR